ncbi:glyoxylase-like metal-dependent hydrolase (beta-lactamase superfamily II) [Bacillus iocasae]|uniref:Glyoxylase-like metal-dependent hydrolase (Beta-lactamase superfamily II) n=1 Tax=Priestia iocasae TaxID=2291674 RepID=A0ABS2QSD7_9BACI|nr:MBL fold metallo-hydrolase [Metabacillus iocasae]MBM7702375.1 glyoxylase-like metal-dependent hydrolase (beta-lactamase superfamily II) [Metabacillus iocasae]
MLKIFELPIAFDFNGHTQTIYPTLLVLDDELTLIDTGYPHFLPKIEGAIISHGYSMSQLKTIVVTHYDDDHIGSLSDFKRTYPQVTIIASQIEAPSISGEVPSERLVQAEKMLKTMPEEQLAFGNWFVSQLKKVHHVPVDQKESSDVVRTLTSFTPP